LWFVGLFVIQRVEPGFEESSPQRLKPVSLHRFMYGLKLAAARQAVPFRDSVFSVGFEAAVWGCFLDRDRVRHRIAVKLSFAHVEGRDYRQLPDRARSRERPTPADIVYCKR
jgi:hypothetical protein